jgi:hypothetical protein
MHLPSSGDTSYAGVLVQEGGTVLISYYSQHEVHNLRQKHYLHPANIYLACVQF